MNVVALTGRLTKDWDVRVTPNGTQIARNSIAVQRKFKNANGDYETDFINLIAFGKTADVVGQYTQKGSQFGVQGRIQTGSYENQQGQRVYTTDIVVDSFDFLERKKDNATNQDTPQYQSVQQTENMQQGEFDLFNISDNDLPF